MVYRGKVKDGVVVFEGPVPAEGAVVRVDVVVSDGEKTLSEKLQQFSGVVPSLPPDLARQHDHYIHGTPKR